jgi:hypothetical protein
METLEKMVDDLDKNGLLYKQQKDYEDNLDENNSNA